MIDRASIADIPLFSRLSNTQLKRVWRLLRITTYQPGEVVIEEGSPAASLLYIIIEGEAALSKKGLAPLTDRPLDYEIDVRGKKKIFGWVSVLDGLPSPTTVMARTPLTVAILDLKKRGGLGSSPHAISEMSLSLSSRLDGHNQLPKIIQGVKLIEGLEIAAKLKAPQAKFAA